VLRLAVLPALLVLAAGCGGITATKSISPATFLLPGLLQADPPADHPDRELPKDADATQMARF
jgi:hypothetical protein